ncbi:DNA (cytosine-5-)-methyltransferase [Candidatus Poriferisodalis sp.]|uniref:DNA (cytosine-5-)-methyltransferase n=1 Tax=Candidatus Poriferisodalis sp. TaxID=3101277 RepID=UPI003D0B4C0D
MEVLPRVRRVDTVRGPRISVAPHPAAADSVVAVQEWVASRALQRPLAADLFCGAGGLSLGLTDAGYDVVVGVDSDTVALETYAGLHPGLTLCRDLNDQDSVAEVAATISKLGVDLIAGGPPCQPFSKAGVSKIRSLVRTGVRPEYDVRRDLWQAFLGVVLRVQPRAVLLENVPDMATSADTVVVRSLVGELEANGYSVHTRLLRARDHGVPQIRQRFLLVALADGLGFRWPPSLRDPVTVRQAIGDLPVVEGGWRPPEAADGLLPYRAPTKRCQFLRRARRGTSGADRSRVYDHITRPVRDDDRLIFDSMTPETRYSDIDDALKRYRDDIFDDKYKRLDWQKPSRSVTAHMARDGYWYIHPDQPRTLTIREAARLQTFPDRVRFAGPPSAAFRQIGNAVPPRLAERVGRSIRRALEGSVPAAVSSMELGQSVATWFENKERLVVPWLEAPTMWSALQAQMLLGQARGNAIQEAWPLCRKLDGPELTIESLDRLTELACSIGRAHRVDLVVDLAQWYIDNRDGLTTANSLADGPGVTPRMAAVAALVDPSSGPTPVVVSQGALRVASRIFGSNPEQSRPGGSGRLAVTRLLGGAGGFGPDESRTAMAGVIELSASLCTPKNPRCGECPLATHCAWAKKNMRLRGS